MSVRDDYNDAFLLPSMGDYYLDSLDHVYYKTMEEGIHKIISTGDRIEKVKAAGLKTAFKYYQENPPDIGYDQRYESYTFGVNIQNKAVQDDYVGDVRIVDGDTIVFPTSSIAAPADDKKLQEFIEVATNYSKQKLAGLVANHGAKDSQCTGGILGLRFACIDTMEIPHFENIGSAELFANECKSNGWDVAQKTFKEAWDNRPLYNVSKFWDYRSTSTAPGAFSVGRPLCGIYNIPTTKTPKGEAPEGGEQLLDFVKIDNRYHQYYIMNDEVYILGVDDSSVVSTNNSETTVTDNHSYDVVADAGLAHKIAFECVLKGTEMRIVVDGSSINQVGSTSGFTGYLRQDQNTSSENITKFIKYIYQQTLHPVSLINTGYSWAGLDVYNRALAVIYIKLKLKNEKGEEESVWINLNKYLVANTNYTNIDSTMHSGPSQARNNFYSDLVKSGNYDLNKILYVDGEYAQSKEFDDRAIIQEQIWKNSGDYTLATRAAETAKFNETDFEEETDVKEEKKLDFMQKLNHWTMTIGDCTFFIPPECIRVETISQNKKLPLVRARGSMQKNSTKIQEILLIDLYFNGDKGINGFEFKTKVPRGDEITYHMNGLRALVAQFRLAPFLPIDNHYVNQVLGIDAVALKAMSTQTVPGFPQLIKVSLQLQNFDYRIYMPEIPIEEDDVFLMRNYFSKQINYQIFRWYYQRLLINGDRLKNVSFFDDQYMRETFGNKTCLVPMEFKSSAVRFYIPNREHLNMMKQVKLSRLIRKAVPTNLNDNQKTVLKDFDTLFNAINNEVGGNDTAYKNLNNILSQEANESIYIQNSGFDDVLNCVKIQDDGETFSFKTDNETEAYKKNVITGMQAAAEEIKKKISDLKNSEGNALCTNPTVSKIYFTEGESQTLAFEEELNGRTNEQVQSFPTVRAVISVSFKIHTSNISKDDMNTLLTYATQQQGDENLKQYSLYSADELLGNDGCTMNIPITIPLKNVNSIAFGGKKYKNKNDGRNTSFLAKFGSDQEAETNNNSLDSKLPRIARAQSNLGVDVSFLATMEEFATANSVGGNELANRLKQSADYEDYNTIKWDYFDMGEEEISIENMSFTEMNTFAEISLSSHNGYAPQFMGGTEVGINFSFKTKSRFAAGALKSLPGVAAEYAREYRLVLTCWPIKIESELTKLMGITDIMIETVDVSTVPGYPGVYDINVTASSVDRTLRNREAMTRKQLDNFTGIDTYSKTVTRERTRKEINDYLAERELYPDLQLPTIKEFNDAGFLFVRYSNAKRMYPDPDFYFTYSYMLYNQLIRESVIRGLNENTNELQLLDSNGNLINGTLYGDDWNSSKLSNEAKKKMHDLGLLNKNGSLRGLTTLSSTQSNSDKNNSNHKVTDYEYDRIDGTFGKVWNIANSIKVCTTEKNFVSDIVAYKRLQEKIKDNLIKQRQDNAEQEIVSGRNPDEAFADVYKVNNIKISQKDVLEERHRILTEQNKKNDETSNTVNQEQSVSLNVLAAVSQPPSKTLTANGLQVEKTTNNNKPEEKDTSKDNAKDNSTPEGNDASNNQNSNDKQNASGLPTNDENKSQNNSSAQNSQQQNTDSSKNSSTKASHNEDTAAQSKTSNTPSEKVDEKDKDAEPYNIKKWNEIAEAAIQSIDDILSKPIEPKEYDGETPMNCMIDYSDLPRDYYNIKTSCDYNESTSLNINPLKNLANDNNMEIIHDASNFLDAVWGTNRTINKFLTAAGAAMSAPEEYSNNDKEKKWKLYPYMVKGTINLSGTKMEISVDSRYEEAYQSAQNSSNENINYSDADEVEHEHAHAENRKSENDQALSKQVFGEQLWSTVSDLACFGTKFGIFPQVMHTEAEINAIFDSTDEVNEKKSVKQENTGLYLIDPYYRNGIHKLSLAELDEQFPRDSKTQTTYGDDYADDDDDETKLLKARQRAIRLYKAKCILDEKFARVAFWRICLVWMRKLINSYIFPSFCYDVFRGDTRIEDIINNISARLIEKRKASSVSGYGGDLEKRTSEINRLIEEHNKAKDSGKATDAQLKSMQENIDKKQKDLKKLMDQYEIQAQKETASEMLDKLVSEKEASSIQEMFDENQKYVDEGKVFLMVLFAVLDTMRGTSSVLKLLVDRDIDQLNSKTRTFLLGGGTKQNLTPEDEMIKKYVKALVGYGVIDSDQLCKGDTTSIGEKILRKVSYNNYVAAANDPQKWLVHSFHDMVVHDARGRMARAFPTFFMCFIDEGRTTRRYKLHDNFYNTSSIADITITKSRKIPADTAEITMSNFYQTFTTDDEDLNYNYTVNISDVIDSIFGLNDEEYAQKLEGRRLDSAPPERFHIRPGARIHIRMGYGGDATSLPILFNGIVTEVSAEDVVNIVAQGDGQELAKPILLDLKAHELPQLDNFLNNHSTNGVTPKVMLDGLFTTYGSWNNKYVHEKSEGGRVESIWDGFGTSLNPFGLYHFGDRDYQYIDGEREPTQNIFEIYMPNNMVASTAMARKKGISTDNWDFTGGLKSLSSTWDSLRGFFGTQDAQGNILDYPLLEFELFNKSIWEIAHILNGIQANYITSIAPFDFRSTFFFGCPHDYYAYSYQYIEDGSTVSGNNGGYWCEKRKPFQQYHIVSSLTDIISNQVAASSENINTCMVGLYKREGWLNVAYTKQTKPIWVDKDIYPEFQKTAYFDTNLYGSPSGKVPILSDAINALVLNGIANNCDFIDDACDTTGEVRSHAATAEILTKNALKENMWDMYQGPLIIIGDPTIKPYDRIRIMDFFQEIHGDVQVRDVVYSFSPSTGFTTAVYPDCIATVADYARDEIRVQTAMGAASGLLSGMVLGGISLFTLNCIKGAFNKFTGNALSTESILKSVAEFLETSENSKAQWLNKKCGRTLKTMAEQGKTTKGIIEAIANAVQKVSGVTGEYASKAKDIIRAGEEANIILRGLSATGRAGISIATAPAYAAGAVAGLAAGSASITLAVASIVASEIIGCVTANNLSREMKNRRALTIFPIKHYNRVMTAGLNGHTGLCYGSPSWSASNMLENTLAKIGEEHPFGAAIFSHFFLGGTDPFEMAAENKKMRLEGMMTQERIPLSIMDEVVDGPEELVLKTKVNPTVKRMRLNSSSARFILKTMGVFNHKPNATRTEISDLKDIDQWKQMVMVKQATSLQKYLNDRYFRIVNDQEGIIEKSGVNENGHRNALPINVPLPNDPNSEIPITTLVKWDENNKNAIKYFDVPFLRPDAIAVLASIIDNAYMQQYGTEQERDEYQKKQNTGTSAIVLKSALRIGESADFAGTGLRFELEATDENSSTALLKGVEETADEFIKEHNHNPRIQKEVFKFKTTTQDNKAHVTVVVMPPDNGRNATTAAETAEKNESDDN